MILQKGSKAFKQVLVGGINPNKPVSILTDRRTMSPRLDVVDYEEACEILNQYLKALESSLRPGESIEEYISVQLIGDNREGYEDTMCAELQYDPKHFVAGIGFGDDVLIEITQPY